jgi:hypothetical protein
MPCVRAALLALAAMAVAAGCEGGAGRGQRPAVREAAGTLVYSSEFAPADGWDTGAVAAQARASLVPGGYLVVGGGNSRHLLLSPYRTRLPAVTVSTEVRTFPTANVSFGVGCRAQPTPHSYGYLFVIYPDRDWFLEEDPPVGPVRILTRGTAEVPPPGIEFVALSCVQPAAGSTAGTRLTGFVNGPRVVEITAPKRPLNSVGWTPLLVVGSFGPSVSVTFRSFSVRDLAGR